MHRFFIAGALSAELNIKTEDSRHIARVLRMKKGGRIIVSDGRGASAIAEITALAGNDVQVKIVEFLPSEEPPRLRLILGQGLGKGDKMDFVVQKAVELGVSDIVPLELSRSVTVYEDGKKTAKRERWQKIAEEAAKQCQRSILPVVHPVQTLNEALADFAAGAKLLCYEDEQEYSLGAALDDAKAVDSLFLLIGPEGGFSDEEVDAARQAGFSTVSLGPRILRTETAAVATLAIIMYELSDLGGKNA